MRAVLVIEHPHCTHEKHVTEKQSARKPIASLGMHIVCTLDIAAASSFIAVTVKVQTLQYCDLLVHLWKVLTLINGLPAQREGLQ